MGRWVESCHRGLTLAGTLLILCRIVGCCSIYSIYGHFEAYSVWFVESEMATKAHVFGLCSGPLQQLYWRLPGCSMFSWGYVSRDFSPSDGVGVWESQLCCASICIGWTRFRWNWLVATWKIQSHSPHPMKPEICCRIILGPCSAVILNRAASVPKKYVTVVCARQMLPTKLRRCILKLLCRRLSLYI